MGGDERKKVNWVSWTHVYNAKKDVKLGFKHNGLILLYLVSENGKSSTSMNQFEGYVIL